MKKIMKWIHVLVQPLDNVRGITGFRDWKFYAVFLLYGLSFLILVRDPFFSLRGEVVFQQGMITLLLAVVLLNTFFWDFQLFGKPTGANLLLQVLAYFPGGIWIARLLGKATRGHDVSFWKDYLGKPILDFVDKNFPGWLVDMVCNWKITVVFILLLVVLSLSMRMQFKIAAVFLFLLVPFLMELSSGREISYLFFGTIFFFIGLGLQFCRYDKVIYFERIYSQLQQGVSIDVMLLHCIMRVMVRLYEDGSLSEQSVRKIVADEYRTARDSNNSYSDLEINQITVCVTKEMIYSFNLVQVQQTASGAMLYPNGKLFVGDEILRGLAVWPRVIAVLVFAIVWSISPIDLIPDATPIIGTLDDVIVCALTTIMVGNTVLQEKENNIIQSVVRKF